MNITIGMPVQTTDSPNAPLKESLLQKTESFMKRLGLGVLLSPFMHFPVTAISSTCRRIGIIPHFGELQSIKDMVELYAKEQKVYIDVEAILSAKCPFAAFISARNAIFPNRLPLTIQTILGRDPIHEMSLDMEKIESEFSYAVFFGPFVEELFFRVLIQRMFLKDFPQFAIKKFLPGNENLLDTKCAVICRILLTSALFSMVHSLNSDFLSKESLQSQYMETFLGGIFLGCVMESPLGFPGAIGLHMSNNFIGIIRSNIIYPEC